MCGCQSKILTASDCYKSQGEVPFLMCGPTMPRDPESQTRDPGGKLSGFEVVWMVVITMVASVDI